MGALASQATVPFIELQYAYKCPLPLSKIKCTKAGHEDPKTHQAEKEGTCTPDQGSGATLGVLGYAM